MKERSSIEKALTEAAVERDGRLTLPCGAAFQIAEELGAGLGDIGEICNDLKIKIVRCQLGCFK